VPICGKEVANHVRYARIFITAPFFGAFQSQHAENQSRRRRANIMIVSIAATFFTLWLPLYIFSFLVELQADLIR
jgi:hypothetical protein